MRALISVYNKDKIADFAKELQKLGCEIISTGGTAQLLKNAKIKVIEVSEYTGFPEMLDGRVKTLNPKIFGGILALRNNDHLGQLKKHKIPEIDIIVCNLYPFKETISKKHNLNDAIENIDIGGPSLIRAAAKNHEYVAVIVDPTDYDKIIEELKQGKIKKETRQKLAEKAFNYTANYDAVIGNYFNRLCKNEFPKILNLSFEKAQDLRYGENPYQRAAFYREPTANFNCITNAKQIQGKELSFNNILDANDALELVRDFDEPTAAVIKHTNPSGIASRKTIEEAYKTAHEADPMSAFGSVVALNRPCNKAVAEIIKPLFVEVVIAPKFDKESLEILKSKKSLRLLEAGHLGKLPEIYSGKCVIGGVLYQTSNFPELKKEIFTGKDDKIGVVTKRMPTKKEIEDMIFAWKVNKYTKSNSVVFVKDKNAIGIGVGQMSRVDASIIAARKAGKRAKNAVMSSDAFFPFRDGIDEAAKAGITAIIQPGGSIRDQEVIDAANEYNIAMVFSGIRLFRH